MSAIGGLWRLDGRGDAAAGGRRMLKAQALYGPDRSDLWSAGDIALGRQLMRLLPEDAYDAQPVAAGGGRFVLVADLRLDNRDELAAALGIAGDRLRLSSDSALLAAAYERWEEDCCERLVGDFAFAAWDAAKRRLVLARDFAGGRPLHYHRGGGFIAFASMPKGLHALAEIPRAPDADFALSGLLGRPLPGSGTMFAGIGRVLPGQVLIHGGHGLTERMHWRPRPPHEAAAGRRDEAEGLRHHLDEAVRCRLRGEDRVGAHLSAGLDSSAVATSAALALADRGRVTAFTAVPRSGYCEAAPYGRLGDEGPLAAATAALYPNIDHVLVRPGLRSPLADIDRDMFLLDQPAVNLCNMGWIHEVNDEARSRGLRVLLTGMRGNLAFSYDGMDLLAELLRKGRLVRLAREIAALRRHGGASVAGAVSAALRPLLPFSAWAALARVAGRGPLRWTHGAVNPVAAAFRLPLDGSAAPLPAPPRHSFDGRAAALGAVDLGNFQKAMLGGWGLDYRDPTGDRRLVEYCLSLPSGRFLRNGVRRALARGALKGRVPEALLDERRRGLQAADWHEGATAARAGLAEELERGAGCEAAAALIDFEKLQGLVAAWPEGGWDDGAIDKAYRMDLLRGISVAHFIRKASGSNR